MRMNNNLKKSIALLLSTLILLTVVPTLSVFGTSASVTLDVQNDALAVTSVYPVSVQVSGIEEDAFADDATNLLRNEGTNFEVCDYYGSAIQTAPTYGTNGSGGIESLYDGMISVGKWGVPYKTDELGNHYCYWYTSSGLTKDTTPKGYVTFTLDAEYVLDDFYIISAAYKTAAALCNYNVYFSTDKDTLFDSENKAITYQYTYGEKLNTANSSQNAEGQIYSFTSNEKPTAQYVGFEIIDGGSLVPNWLFLSEVGFHGEKNNVTLDVQNDALSVTSVYPVSVQVSDIAADAFTGDTKNILHSENMKIVVYNKEKAEMESHARNTVSSGGRGALSTAVHDGRIDTGWAPYDTLDDGTYLYSYWYITSGLTNDGNPEGYIVIDLGAEYKIDDFYIMSAYSAKGALGAYDVFFADSEDALFGDENCAISYSYTGYADNHTGGKLNTADSNKNSEGQIFTFTGEEKPTARYVGIEVNEGGKIQDGWLFLAELGFHGEEVKELVPAALDLSALNDETSISGGTSYIGESYEFSVITKNGATVTEVAVNGTVLVAKDGIYTIPEVADGMKIMVKTDRDALATKNDVWNGVDLSLNDSLYGKAIWSDGVTYNESIMLYNGRNSVKLLYPIDDVVSVRSYDLQTTYWKGEDFDVVNGEFVPLADGNLVVYENADDIKTSSSSGAGVWNTTSHNYQYYVTYTHSSEWDGTQTYNEAPESEIEKLTGFYDKITSQEETQIVFYGDSITVGYNASGLNQESYMYDADAVNTGVINARKCTMYGNLGLSAVPEWACDTYAVQLTDAMKTVYGNPNVTMVNKAVASSASTWGASEKVINALLSETNPDLFVLAYGMNERNVAKDTHIANIRTIIDYARELNPNCSVLLVSTFYPNIWDTTNNCFTAGNLAQFEEGYYELLNEYDNIAVAPVYSMFESLLTVKESCDYTSNIYNHPNDFGSRIYGDMLTTVLSPVKPCATVNLKLNEQINVIYNVNKADLTEAGYTEPRVEFTLNGSSVSVAQSDENEGFIGFDFTSVNPKNIGDEVTAKVYARDGEKELLTRTDTFSVRQYCEELINDYTGEDAQKVRAVAKGLLNFAGASQTYFNYNTESLANAGNEDYALTRTLHNAMALSKVDGEASVKWLSAGLNFSSNIALRFKISAADIDGIYVKAVVNGDVWFIPSSAFLETSGGYYVYFNKLTVAQMSDTVDLTVYAANGTQLSDTLTYSIESYAAAKADSTGAIGNLVRAMINYGDAARNMAKE